MSRLLISAIAAALLLSSCSNSVDPYAIKIDDIVISDDIIDNELQAVVTNSRAADALNQQLAQVGGLRTGGKNTLNTQYTSNVVYTRIVATLLEREATKQGVEVTPERYAAAEKSIREQPEQSEAIDSFPSDYRNYLIERQAQLEALIDSRSTPEKVREYFDKNKAQLTKTCVRHILATDQAAASDARARVVGGQDFAAVSNELAAQQGGATGGAPVDGGELGCRTDSELSQLVPQFADAVRALPTGGLSEPVQTQFGFHILQVKSRNEPLLEEVKPQISQELGNAGQLLIDLMAGVDIKLNPRYGDYIPADPNSNTPGQVVPHRSTGLQPPVKQQDEGSTPDGLPGSPQQQP